MRVQRKTLLPEAARVGDTLFYKHHSFTDNTGGRICWGEAGKVVATPVIISLTSSQSLHTNIYCGSVSPWLEMQDPATTSG